MGQLELIVRHKIKPTHHGRRRSNTTLGRSALHNRRRSRNEGTTYAVHLGLLLRLEVGVVIICSRWIIRKNLSEILIRGTVGVGILYDRLRVLESLRRRFALCTDVVSFACGLRLLRHRLLGKHRWLRPFFLTFVARSPSNGGGRRTLDWLYRGLLVGGLTVNEGLPGQLLWLHFGHSGVGSVDLRTALFVLM